MYIYNFDFFNVYQICPLSYRPDLTLRDSNGRTALWLALTHIPKDVNLHESTFAAKLLRHGCSPDYIDPLSGNSLLHAAAASALETAGLFLVSHHAQLNIMNNHGETPLHIAARNGLRDLVATLLSMGADPNVASYPSLSGLDDVQLGLDVNGSKDSSNVKPDSVINPPECGLRTPLHYAVLSKRVNIVDCILKHKG